MYSREQRIHIDAPPEDVFRYVTDIKRHPEWASNPMEMTVDSDPVAVGTTFSSRVKAFGTETARGKVLQLQPPSLFAYETDTSSSGRYTWKMTLTPAAGGTDLHHRFDRLSAPAWFRIVQPLMFPVLGKNMMKKGLRSIKTNVEANTATQSPVV
jgi:uncharacterized protein YndB with AHSA1/START domain